MRQEAAVVTGEVPVAVDVANCQATWTGPRSTGDSGPNAPRLQRGFSEASARLQRGAGRIPQMTSWRLKALQDQRGDVIVSH